MSAELFDVLDSSGNPTGAQKTKYQIFDDGDWRLVTHAWIVNAQQEVLCQQRASKGLWDNLWDVTVGGGVASGEASRDACARELDEELGLQIPADELLSAGRFETTKPLPERDTVAHEFSDTYILEREVALADLVLREAEVVAVAWLPLAQVGVNVDDRAWMPHPQGYYDAVRAVCGELK